MRTIELRSPDGDQVLRDIQSDPPVLFIGSAMSAFTPSCLPAGRTFADALFEFIFPSAAFGSTAERSICRSLFERVPFEHVMESCPRGDLAERIVRETLDCSVPNELHRAVGSALLAGQLRAIITPNYDRCLEAVDGIRANVCRVVT